MSDSDSQQTTLPFSEGQPAKKTARKATAQRRGRTSKAAAEAAAAAQEKDSVNEAEAPVARPAKKAVRRGRVARKVATADESTTAEKATVTADTKTSAKSAQAPEKETSESKPEVKKTRSDVKAVAAKAEPAQTDSSAPKSGEKQSSEQRSAETSARAQGGGGESGSSGDEQRSTSARDNRERQSGQGGGRHQQGRKGRQRNHPGKGGGFSNRDKKFKKFRKSKGGFAASIEYGSREPDVEELLEWDVLQDEASLTELANAADSSAAVVDFDALYQMDLPELERYARDLNLAHRPGPRRKVLLEDILRHAAQEGRPIEVSGILELYEDGFGFLVYSKDSYQLEELCTLVPKVWIRKYGLLRGHELKVQVIAPREEETTPVAVKVLSVMGDAPEKIVSTVPFTELVPYYPTQRLLLETSPDVRWDNISMRCVDLLTPIGLGQRGLIVAPPRTGKTVLLQGMANAIAKNNPEAHLIVLLIDERPEEVTDFRRNTSGEVISSTFDESAESHVHAAEMVIEKARRMVEAGRHVVILLDSITRLARAYNTLMPNSGKILSGGVEANALQKPKRFFGSARNIEGGGSLTILGTALIDTGSRMDEVIFEEFKGTGNMELHLDRALVDKRVFPALSFEKSGTRKEELLYHPDEMNKIYSLRRAMKGVPSTEAMELLIQRVKKTKSNVEFLMSMSR